MAESVGTAGHTLAVDFMGRILHFFEFDRLWPTARVGSKSLLSGRRFCRVTEAAAIGGRLLSTIFAQQQHIQSRHHGEYIRHLAVALFQAPGGEFEIVFSA